MKIQVTDWPKARDILAAAKATSLEIAKAHDEIKEEVINLDSEGYTYDDEPEALLIALRVIANRGHP